jgi:hypothetical protein
VGRQAPRGDAVDAALTVRLAFVVAEGHGGRIHVEARREQPATFVLTLPAS